MPMHSKKPSVGVELRAGGDPHRSEKPGWSARDMRQQLKKEKKNAQASGFSHGSFVVSSFNLFKVSKITTKFLACLESVKQPSKKQPSKKKPSKKQISYSESEPDFSFAINSVSDSDSHSDFNSDSDSNSALINLGICIFFILYLHSSK